MPIVSIFFGVIIRFNFADHAPPHLHAEWKQQEALFAIRTGKIIAGALPGRIGRLVRRWTEASREALMRNWDLAYADLPTFKIPGPEAK